MSGSLPPGLTLPTTFTGPGDTISGTPTDPGTQPNFNFTLQGTGDQGQPLFQAYSIMVDPDQPLTIVPPASGSTLSPGTAGQPYAQNFFLSGGAAPSGRMDDADFADSPDAAGSADGFGAAAVGGALHDTEPYRQEVVSRVTGSGALALDPAIAPELISIGIDFAVPIGLADGTSIAFAGLRS